MDEANNYQLVNSKCKKNINSMNTIKKITPAERLYIILLSGSASLQRLSVELKSQIKLKMLNV